MQDDTFRLITYQEQHDQSPNVLHPGLVIGDAIIALDGLAPSHPLAQQLEERTHASLLTPGLQGLLFDWDRHFDMLSTLGEFVGLEGIEDPRRYRGTVSDQRIHVLAPVLRPSKMLYAASNYAKHIAEAENWQPSGRSQAQGIDKAKTQPYSFLKLPSCIVGPYDPVVFPRGFAQLDYEVELALVIGRRGKHIPEEHAMEYVAGFLIANDMSLRDLTVRQDWPNLRSDWFVGKNFDTSAPLGPYLVPRRFVPKFQDLRLTLRVNGVTKQDASTRDMIFSPQEQIAFLSRFMTLEPGDILATGTPSGVGFGTGDYLKVGDLVEAEIEGLGQQRTRIIEKEA
jgi:2-keto-4-pentenoate hydratase/2-oxohepta-3-ene-1,7-dioic acid hydratase in catechol pathway